MALCLLPQTPLRRCQYLDIRRPVAGSWVNWKVFRRKWPLPNKVLSQYSPGGIGKTMQTSAKTVGVLSKIRTQRFLNICLQLSHSPALWRCINCWDYDWLIIRFFYMPLILILGTEDGCPDRFVALRQCRTVKIHVLLQWANLCFLLWELSSWRTL